MLGCSRSCVRAIRFGRPLGFAGSEPASSVILSGRKQNNSMMNVINSKIIQHTVSEKKSLLGLSLA